MIVSGTSADRDISAGPRLTDLTSNLLAGFREPLSSLRE